MFSIFKPSDHLTHLQAVDALHSGCTLLISRCAFSSEDEVRESYPPKSGEEAIWRENAKPWYEERRHMYVVCIDPTTSQYITSSSEPDKTHAPWRISFCSETMAITQLDIEVCLSAETWRKYDTAAVVLSKIDYPPERVTAAIQSCRKNLNNPTYSIDSTEGYDCQTATRDVLWAANQTIDPKTLSLPPRTNILAYYSKQILQLEFEHCERVSHIS